MRSTIPIPYAFCKIQRIPPQSLLAVHSVCAQKKADVHTQPILARIEPLTIRANQHSASGARQGGVQFDWLLLADKLLQNQIAGGIFQYMSFMKFTES